MATESIARCAAFSQFFHESRVFAYLNQIKVNLRNHDHIINLIAIISVLTSTMNDETKSSEDYRRILSTARKLETLQSNLESITDFFLSPLVKLYSILCDDCSKLFFESESFKLDQCRKAEELIWRRIYHVIYRFQRSKRDSVKRHDECLVESHFISGIGFYSSLIIKLRLHYRIRNVPCILEPLNLSLGPLDNFVDTQRLNEDDSTNVDEDKFDEISNSNYGIAKEWARQAIYRSLIYMGDLARYLLETSHLNYRRLAFEFYRSASQNQPDNGLPFNQLATLAGSFNHNLGAVCNYMRCCLRPKPFEGAEGNMRKIFELNNIFYGEITKQKNVYKVSDVLSSKDPGITAESMMKVVIVTFIKLTSELWEDNSEGVEITEFFEHFRECLELGPIIRGLGLVQPGDLFCSISGYSGTSELPKYPTPTIMYEFCSVSMMLIAKHQQRSSMNDLVINWVNTLTLNLLYYSTSKCQEMIMSKLQELRLGHQTESQLAYIYNHTYLTTIKIYCDWLLSNRTVVSSNLQSFRAFACELNELSSLLRKLIDMNPSTNSSATLSHNFNGPSWVQKYPLSCDFPLMNLQPLKDVHATNIDFGYQRDLDNSEAGFITAQCVIAFSHALNAFLNNKQL